MKIEWIDVDDIIIYQNNAKRHPREQVEQIANSINEFGFQQPIVIDKNNEIIIGHGRLQAALLLGFNKVPVYKAINLNEQQVKALRLADNKLNESEWDFSLLEKELKNIGLDMAKFGFDLSFDGENEVDVSTDDITNLTENICCPRCGHIWEE